MNLFKNLLERRVPQFVGLYLAVSWGLVEFVDWLVERYVLSPHLTDLALVALASLLPSVLLVAYTHGKPGRDRLTRAEKIGVPLNLAVSVALLAFLFGAKELGSATTAVKLEDESGDTVEVVVPKSEFRKRLALYFFENESGDTALDWLQYGLPWAIEADLNQDLFLDVRTFWPWFADRLREAGYPDGLSLPLALQREVADDLHLGYFATGVLTRGGEGVSVDVSLYDSERAGLIGRRSWSGSDPLALVDEITTQIRRDLGIPAQHVEATPDLPVEEILTASRPAYRSFVEGYRAMAVEEDYTGAARHLEEAVQADPGYAAAHVVRYLVHILLNDTGRAGAALTAAMENLYRLPERDQFTVKSEYYWLVRQDIQKSIAVSAMYTELFPDDVMGYARLGTYYSIANDRQRAISAFDRILQIDSTQTEYLQVVGQLHEQEGDFERALEYYGTYADRSPDDPGSFRAIGRLQHTIGEHEAAIEQYERALLLEPGDVESMIELAGIETDLGRFEDAAARLQEALGAAKTASQTAAVHNALQGFHQRRGQLGRAVESMHRQWAELERSQPPLTVLQQKLGDLDTYVAAGRQAEAESLLESLRSSLSPPFDRLAALGEIELYEAAEEPDRLEAAIEHGEQMIAVMGLEVFRPLLIWARGRAQELRGQCQDAVLSYERILELQPTHVYWNLDLGRCYRKLGRPEEARRHLERALGARPADGRAHYEMALVERDLGDRESALRHVDAALDAWSEADPDFRPAEEARRLRGELGEMN